MKSVIVFVLIKHQDSLVQDDQVLLCDPVGRAGLQSLPHQLMLPLLKLRPSFLQAQRVVSWLKESGLGMQRMQTV